MIVHPPATSYEVPGLYPEYNLELNSPDGVLRLGAESGPWERVKEFCRTAALRDEPFQRDYTLPATVKGTAVDVMNILHDMHGAPPTPVKDASSHPVSLGFSVTSYNDERAAGSAEAWAFLDIVAKRADHHAMALAKGTRRASSHD